VTISIVDTSILDELLNVPVWSKRHEEVLSSWEERSQRRETFLLPVAVLFEAGNHIAQVNDGRLRRDRADRFAQLAKNSLAGRSPFVATPLPGTQDLGAWLDAFPDHATRGVSLTDESLIALWQDQRELNPLRRVYIWSLDEHLRGYDTAAPHR
jgi:hypothetical protein